MTEETKTTATPAQANEPKTETPPIVIEKYSYAALVLNENFAEIVQNLHYPMKTNPFAKTSGIPSLEYFNEMMTEKTESAKLVQTFVKNCENSPDVMTNFPKPASTIGTEMYSIPFVKIPVVISHIRNLYAALQYFRGLAGYVEEAKPKAVKNVSMDSLKKVREDGVKSNR